MESIIFVRLWIFVLISAQPWAGLDGRLVVAHAEVLPTSRY